MLFCLQLGSEVSRASTGEVFRQDERQLFWLSVGVNSASLSDGEMAPGQEVFHTSCLMSSYGTCEIQADYFLLCVCVWSLLLIL